MAGGAHIWKVTQFDEMLEFTRAPFALRAETFNVEPAALDARRSIPKLQR